MYMWQFKHASLKKQVKTQEYNSSQKPGFYSWFRAGVDKSAINREQ